MELIDAGLRGGGVGSAPSPLPQPHARSLRADSHHQSLRRKKAKEAPSIEERIEQVILRQANLEKSQSMQVSGSANPAAQSRAQTICDGSGWFTRSCVMCFVY